jgi:hypothetical protein
MCGQAGNVRANGQQAGSMGRWVRCVHAGDVKQYYREESIQLTIQFISKGACILTVIVMVMATAAMKGVGGHGGRC